MREPVGQVARPVPVQPVHQIARVTGGGALPAKLTPHRRVAVLALTRPLAREPTPRVKVTRPARAAHAAPRKAAAATTNEKKPEGRRKPMPLRVTDMRREKGQTGRAGAVKPDRVAAVQLLGPAVVQKRARPRRTATAEMAVAEAGGDTALPALRETVRATDIPGRVPRTLVLPPLPPSPGAGAARPPRVPLALEVRTGRARPATRAVAGRPPFARAIAPATYAPAPARAGVRLESASAMADRAATNRDARTHELVEQGELLELRERRHPERPPNEPPQLRHGRPGSPVPL